MDMSQLNMSILTNTAITALKNAYEHCGDAAAKESVITAFKAIIQLHQDLSKFISHDLPPENENDCDPSEYCAAV